MPFGLVSSAYCGFDPTGKSLHIGHLVPVMMMYWFQKCGSQPYTLVGGATAMIGDPFFKDKTRPVLTVDDIQVNVDSIKHCYAQFITYGRTVTKQRCSNNADWILKPITWSFCAITEHASPSTGCCP